MRFFFIAPVYNKIVCTHNLSITHSRASYPDLILHLLQVVHFFIEFNFILIYFKISMYMCNFRRKFKAVKVANNGINTTQAYLSVFVSLLIFKSKFLNV